MKRKHILIFDGILLVLIPLLLLASKWMLSVFPACTYAEKGIICPSCGATRFVFFLTSGQLSEAFRVHPYFFCTALLGVLLWVFWHLAVLTQNVSMRRLFTYLLRPYLLVIWAIGYGIFGILRFLLTL